ncbi:unnamed protein product [Euphydryas editha]|uniref:Reverse transcriptase domain-containing protein n=1 Tax=Euphydryas editha TaxID=104508 RepID=A0AAU9UWH0_EUPED|nr:unnamed protein product [Euphydryas editha]
MPTDTMVNLMEFTYCLSSVSAVIDNINIECVYNLGDFNAHPNERFYEELTSFCDEQNWSCIDVHFLGISTGTYIFHSNNDLKNFWKSTNKLSGRPGLLVSVEGMNDHILIANMFRDHFTVISPLGPSQLGRNECTGGQEIGIITAKAINNAIASMSRGKSPGHDAKLFHGRNKQDGGTHAAGSAAQRIPPTGKWTDVSDKSNYRPIILATVVSKVLDSLLSVHLDKCITLHDYQFGFRPGLSTESAILFISEANC